MIQLAWRFLLFQKNSALSQWYRARTESAGKKRKTVIVAGTFARAYAANRRAAIEIIIEADPIATCVRTMMANRTMWTGSASDLLSLCAESARNEISTGGAWAKNPRALAGRLRRAQTFLRSLGIEITFSREGRTGTRIIKVSTRAENCVSTNSIVSAARGNGSRGDQAMLADLRE
jgi:hypothetical protein